MTYVYLVLEDGAPGFPQGVSDPVVLGIPLTAAQISLTGLSPSLAKLPSLFCYPTARILRSRNPYRIASIGLDYSPFARHYLGNLVLDLYS